MMMRLLAAAVFTVLPVESSAANATRGLKVRREDTVTILHVSDTHSLHYSLGDLPSADIFIHSGDVSTVGSDGEVGDFNNWLGSLKGKYREMLVISGNHDYWETNWRLNRGALSDATAQSPNYFQEKITNAKVLNHDLVEVMGLKIWGAGWAPRRGDSFSGNNYDDVPVGVDILVTHDGPVGIFDSTAGGSWGSSQQLRSAIYRSKAKKLQAEIEALKQELDGNKRDMERHRGIFQIFGLDPDCSLEVARKFFETLTAPPPADDSASEVDQLKAKNAALLKQQKTLEEEIQKLKRLADESSKKLQAQVKELQEENEKLKSQLSTKTLPPGPEKKKDDGKKEADLQRQLDLLKKQLTDATKGNDAMAKLMKRNEDLEAEVAQLKEELKAKTREATESTQAADFARRQSTDLMAQMEQMRKQLDDAKKELDDERRRSSVKVPVERPSSEEDRQLQDKLKRTKDENENLKQENKQLRDALDEAKIMRKALEQAMDELKRKFEEFKKKLQEKGVDVSLLDEALLEVGMPSHPMNVFDRLYQDAVRRFNRFQEKWVIDMKNAQQETWERILGIYDGPPLTKEQVTALVQNGLIDIRRFAFDEPPSRMICPKCGYNLRSGTPDRPRPHSQPSESQRPRFGRMKTWAGSMAGSLSPKGGGNQPDVFARQDIYLDIVGFQPHQAQDRKPFAIVSEADQYMHHCHLQRFEPLSLSADADASAVGREMTPSKMETPKGATPSPSPCAKDAKTPKTPKLVTLESAMSMDLDDREVMVVSAPSPVNMEPPAPPVTQRRISARDAKLVEGSKRLTKGNVMSASMPAMEPFTAIISGSKALPLPQIAGPQQSRSRSPPDRGAAPAPRRLSRTNSQPLRRDPVDISISGVSAAR